MLLKNEDLRQQYDNYQNIIYDSQKLRFAEIIKPDARLLFINDQLSVMNKLF